MRSIRRLLNSSLSLAFQMGVRLVKYFAYLSPPTGFPAASGAMFCLSIHLSVCGECLIFVWRDPIYQKRSPDDVSSSLKLGIRPNGVDC